MQAEELQTHLIAHKQKITDVFSSHLVRATMTASIAKQTLQLEPRIIDDLHECNFGVLENQRITPDNYQKHFEQWLSGSTPPGAESYQEFAARTARSVNKCLEITSGIPLIVSHGGFFMVLSKHLGFNFLQIDNCELVYITPRQDSKQWEITSLNLAGQSKIP